ncbi:MAG: leucine-rich repeat protein [Clostridia bacterium]|nr:leucine-rich repeat protein [Clostridia bacterium]
MKKGFLKFVAVFMAVLMTAVYLPASEIESVFDVDASAGYVGGIVWTDLSMGGKVKWKYTPKNDTVTVFGSGNMKDYNSGEDGQHWEALWGGSAEYPIKHAKKIVIESGVTNIGNNAFVGFKELQEVVIASTVKSIGAGAFKNNAKLTKITIPSAVTVISNEAFSGCTSLPSINIHNKITSIGSNAFYDCRSLSSVSLPSSVKTIGNGAFRGCSSLKSVTLPANVTVINNDTFYGCTALSSVNLNDGITSIGNNAFRDCVSLPSTLNVPATVKTIGDSAFRGCSKLSALTLKEGLSTISANAFADTKITSVDMPYSVKTIGNNAFGKVTINCCYDDAGYNYCQKHSNATAAIRKPELKAVVVPSSVPGQVIASFYVKNASRFNAANFEITYNKDIYPVDADSFNETKTFLKAVEFAENNKISIGIADAEEVAYSACSGECEYKIAELKFNYAEGTHAAKFEYSSAILMLNNEKSVPESITAEYGEHSFVQSGNPVDATCTEYGYTLEICSVCKEERQVSIIDAPGHAYEDVVTPPTCEEDGFTTHTCSRCNDVYTDEIIIATGHNLVETMVDATCTEKGKKTLTCDVCGISNVVEEYETNPENHVTTEIRDAVDATCTEKGFSGNTHCAACGILLANGSETPVVPHSYESVVTAPTCSEKGFTTHTCSVCKDLYTDTPTETVPHSYESVVTPPTCTEKGFTTFTCSVCKYSYKGAETAALDHDYVETVVAPTCKDEGYTAHTCSVCGDTYNDNITSKTDTHTYETTENVEPTCGKDGYKIVTCTVCAKENKVLLPKTGEHTYGADNKCTVCGDEKQTASALEFNDKEDFVQNDETKTVIVKKPATAAQLREAMVNDGWVVTDAEGNALADTKAVSTGCLIKSADGSQVYSYAMLGDVSQDGKLSAADARLALRISAKLDVGTDIMLVAADCDGKVKVTASDARVILRVSAKLQEF